MHLGHRSGRRWSPGRLVGTTPLVYNPSQESTPLPAGWPVVREMPVDYDQIAAEYSQHRQTHPKVVEALIATANIGATSQVLEVGCGTGNYIRVLFSQTGCAAWGIDPSPEMLAQAQQPSGGPQLLCGRAEALPAPSQTFDLLFSVDVIHHIQDRPRYLAEAYRALRPGGALCTVTDSAWIIRHRVPLALYFPETVPLELARYPRIAVLRQAMAQVGFQAIRETHVELAYLLHEIQAYRDKAFSALHLISSAAFQRGLTRLEEELRRGPIACVSRYLLLWGTR
jgi:ubiquinone/menaquinone biosynthesis C-methylase UbiE